MVLAAFRRLSGSGERSELPGVRGGAPRGRAARQLAALAACHEVQRAVQQADDPLGPPKSARVLRTWLSEGWERNPCEAWWAPGAADGTADGWYWMELPDKENLSRAVL